MLAETQGINRGIKDVNSKLDGFGKTAGKAANAAKVAFVAAGAAIAGSKIVGFMGDAIGKASDLQEAISKTGVIFGPASKTIIDFSKTTATSLGQTQQQALDAASTFATFGKSAGLSGKALSDFAIQNTTLASDLASFHNASPEEAINAIGAALRGETEPMRRFGVMLDDASLRAEAMKQGLISTTKDALTPQQKALAANALIMKQTKDAQGDFSRTSGGLANQQRILSAQWENFKTTLGTALLPIVLKVVSALNKGMGPAVEFITNAIGPAVAAVKGFFKNLGGGSGQSSWVGKTLVPAIQGLVEKFKGLAKVALPIVLEVFNAFKTKWSQIAPQVTAIFNSVKSVISDALSVITSVIGIATSAIQFIWQRFGGNILQFVTSAFGNMITVIQGAFQVIQGIFQVVSGLLRGDFSKVWTGLKNIVKGAWKVIGAIVKQAFNILRFTIKNGWTVIKTVTGAAWNGIKALLGKAWGGIKSLMSKAWDGLKTTARNKISDLVGVIKTIPEKLKNGLSNAGGILKSAGENVVKGLWDGIKSMGSWLTDKVWDWVKSVLPKPVEIALGINSPSRVFREIGKYTVAGLAAGISDNGENRRLSAAASRMTDALRVSPSINTTSRTASRAAGTAAPTIIQVTINAPVGSSPAAIGKELQRYLNAYADVGGRARA